MDHTKRIWETHWEDRFVKWLYVPQIISFFYVPKRSDLIFIYFNAQAAVFISGSIIMSHFAHGFLHTGHFAYEFLPETKVY